TIRFDNVLVVRKAGSAPADSTDGAAVYSGIAASTTDTGLSNGTNYHYAVFVQRDGQTSTAARVNTTPLDPASTIAYTSQPAGAYGNGGDITVGAVFHVTDDKVLLTLGRVYKAGATGSNQIGIWNATSQALLASVTVTNS